MIVAMINRGYSDFVIDASRDAGATGATVLYGRSSIKKMMTFSMEFQSKQKKK